MAFPERTIETVAQPSIPYAEGQRLGSAGASIPQEIIENYRRYHEQGMRSDIASPAARDAALTVAGYVGELAEMVKLRKNVQALLLKEDGRVVSPTLLLTNPDRLEDYSRGYGFQRPAISGEGEASVHKAEAHALGFVVAATKLGVGIDRVPADDFEWAAFQYGMTAAVDKKDRGFYELLIRVEADPATSERLIKMNVLGREIQSAIQRAARQTANPA
jgi:hypothetical protein